MDLQRDSVGAGCKWGVVSKISLCRGAGWVSTVQVDERQESDGSGHAVEERANWPIRTAMSGGHLEGSKGEHRLGRKQSRESQMSWAGWSQ